MSTSIKHKLKYLLPLAICLLTACAAFSSGIDTIPKTITFTVTEVQQEVSYREALKKDIEAYKEDVRILQLQVANWKRAVDSLDKLDANSQNQITSLNRQIAIYDKLIATDDQEIAALKKEVKRWRRKLFWTGVGGLAATASFAILFFIK